jgi:hypothetical protein
MKKIVIVFLWCLIMAAPAVQGGAADGEQEPAPVLAMTVIPAQSAVSVGGQVQILVRLSIVPPFHINSHQPADPGLIATSFTLPYPPSAIKLLRVDYPRPEELEMEGDPEPWLVFSNQSVLKLTLQANPEAETGEYQLRGQLDYQACDGLICQMPDRQYADFTVHIVKNTHD